MNKLEQLFKTMQEDVQSSHHLSIEYLEELKNILLFNSEKIEEIKDLINNSSLLPYSNEELEDDFDYSSPDEPSMCNSTILAIIQEMEGETVKWRKLQEEYFNN